MSKPAITVLCGNMAALPAPGGDVLRLNIHGAKEEEHRLELALADITVPMAANLPPAMIDLLEIATYVFSADQYVGRGGLTMRGMGGRWRRTFSFRIPVRAYEFWRQPELVQLLGEVLGFLTDDEFAFDFSPMMHPPHVQPYLDLQSSGAKSGFRPDNVLLFSGGLDSLAGAVDLLAEGRKLALVSHRSAAFVVARQNELVAELRDRSPASSLFHVGIRVGKENAGTREFTQRSRSFLFASLGAVVAELFGLDKVTFCENGVTSINLPLATHVLGARATRTTHPRVLAGFSKIFSMVAHRQIDVVNRYFWKTKAEVLRRLGRSEYADLAARSVSCTRTMDMSKSSGRHCGKCSQCVDRFFTMRAAGLAAHEGSYDFDILRGERQSDTHLVLAESYVLSAIRWAERPTRNFAAAHGELFRIVPWINMTPHEGITALAEMLRRHGRDVVQVLEDELTRDSLRAVISGPSRTLLGLTRNQVDPLARLIAHEHTDQKPPSKPSRIEFKVENGEFVVANGPTFRGAQAMVLIALLECSRSPRSDAKMEGFTSADALSKRLGITPEALRRRISDIRKKFTQGYVDAGGIPSGENALIENDPWRGYRLSKQAAQVGELRSE